MSKGTGSVTIQTKTGEALHDDDFLVDLPAPSSREHVYDKVGIEAFDDLYFKKIMRRPSRYTDYNPNHEPAGSSKGGQFTSAGGSGEREPDEYGMRETTPEHFIRMRDKSNRPGFLSPLVPEDLLEHTLIVNGDGTVGAAVSPDGDIQNVFNNGGPKGGAAAAIRSAMQRGGKTLDCYDGFLPAYYSNFGFSETERLTFDPQYAPKNWDYEKYDNPDVVFMKRAA